MLRIMALLGTVAGMSAVLLAAPPANPSKNLSKPIERGGLPYRVHVFEDFETQIEKRWWLRGQPVEDAKLLPPSLSASVPNTRACRAAETKDFDRKMGDQDATYKAVVFNPVPGPPMGKHTRVGFRYWIKGTDTLRVQIYSLTNNYHRYLTLEGLPQGKWQAATVDMTQARRPDGSGGPLSEDERIDDIQFYITPDAELLIDDIVLYDAAVEGETRPFPNRFMFTGWFDTGKQGAEWPGEFQIVPHQKPLTWDAAKSIPNADTGFPKLRVQLRGLRPLSAKTRFRFRYKLTGGDHCVITLDNSKTGQSWDRTLLDMTQDRWDEAQIDFDVKVPASADQIEFLPPENTTLLLDDLLLYEPADAGGASDRK